MRRVREIDTSDATRASLAEMMVGREVSFAPDKPNVEIGPTRLAIEGLCAFGDRETAAVDHVTLEVRGGEILGIAGVSGNGQRELAEVVAGLRKGKDACASMAGMCSDCRPEGSAPPGSHMSPRNGCETVRSASSASPRT